MPLTTYRPRPRLHAVLVMLALVLTAGAVPGVAPVPAHAAAAIDTGRLEFGLANGPGDLGWMTSSGVPWRYRYQYLSAGVNTGQGWETWQDPAKPPGQFLTDYIAASRSASYVPVFTYYELLQSTPSSG